MEKNFNSFIRYFNKELSVLEDECAIFATEHPQIASNLGLNREGSTDPHVKQIIESVAFIAARLKQHMDGIPGELVDGLIRAIAPHQYVPIPSMAVARFTPIGSKIPVVGSSPPEDFPLQVEHKGTKCIFQSRYADIKLWPFTIEIIDSEISHGTTDSNQDENVITIEVRSNANTIPKGSPGELTFFISGSVRRALSAMDSIGQGIISGVMCASDDSWSIRLDKENFTALGFDSVHRMMPEQFRSGDVSSLIQEYMHFPQRYCFFKISGLITPASCNGFKIKIRVKPAYIDSLHSVKEKILLNCVPIINIYKAPVISIKINNGCSEYAIPKQNINCQFWDAVAINSVSLQSTDAEIDIPQFRMGIETTNKREAADYISWEQIRVNRPGESNLKSSLELRIQGMDKERYLGQIYQNALIETYACQTTAPTKLEAGRNLNILGWESGYLAALETPPSEYIGHPQPTHDRTIAIIKSMQMQTGRVSNLKHAIDAYLQSLDRTETAHTKALLSSLVDIKREVIAVPHPEAPLGAMLTMGLRYTLTLTEINGIDDGNYVKSRILALALRNVQGEVLSSEIVTHGRDKEVIHVD